jgi:hypothetical protein
MRPNLASVEEIVALAVIAAPGETRRRQVENASSEWPCAFIRQTVAGKHTIALFKKDGAARIPITRVLWSLPFADALTRDVFYDWMCDRLDAWEAWAAMCWEADASALTLNLLGLVAATMPERAPEIAAIRPPPN